MEQNFEITGQLRVDCRLTAGQVRILPAEPGHARVELTPHGEAGDELLRRAEVRLEESGRGRRRLVVHLPGRNLLSGVWSLTGRGSVAVTIHCPPDSELQARTGAAGVQAQLDLANVDVVTGSGDVTLGDVTGSVAVRVASGRVRLGRVGGALDVDTGAGALDVVSVEGGVKIRTASGAIDLGRVGGHVKITAAAGDVRIACADHGQLAVTATTGNVDIGVPPGRGLHLDLSSTIGKVRSELDAAPEGVPGAPDLVLRVRSTTGDVTLRRMTAPAPSTGA
ncbi:DUF4097 domain-containing protein [Egicoccus sp. AB-alg2]|uniref:DUF4097 family beta strand repeat-containing protein n=1 Tax=Egicoccus sp. AB-alg2 TaxID=3242693 RepID=UPI00359D11C4